MLTLQKLAQEYSPFHNHLCVVHDCKLVRLVGVVDGGDDFYYKVVELGGKVSLCSAVGSCVSLKAGYPDAERYEQLDKVFGYNGAPATEEFEVTELISEAEPANLPITFDALQEALSRSVITQDMWQLLAIGTGGEVTLSMKRVAGEDCDDVRIRYRKTVDDNVFVTLVVSQAQWDKHPGGEAGMLKEASNLIDWLGAQTPAYAFLEIDNRDAQDVLAVRFEERPAVVVENTRKAIHAC